MSAGTNYPQNNDAHDDAAAGQIVPDVEYKPPLREGPGMYTDSVYKRAIWLTSDAIVLTIAAPFFAIWWIGRTIKRIVAPK